VDVSRGAIRTDEQKVKTNVLNREMALDPKAFFEKYHLENQRGDIGL